MSPLKSSPKMAVKAFPISGIISSVITLRPSLKKVWRLAVRVTMLPPKAANNGKRETGIRWLSRLLELNQFSVDKEREDGAHPNIPSS